MSLFYFFTGAFHFIFIYLFLAALGLCCLTWPSLAVPVFIAMVSLVAKHML